MKRILVKVGVAGAAAVFGGAVVSACAHNDATIFISQVFAPSTPTNGTCTFTADPTQPTLSVGTADLSFNIESYTPEILVGNQLVTQANVNTLQAETSRVNITGAITRYTSLAGGDVISLLQSMCSANDAAACATGRQLGSSLTVPSNPFSTAEATVLEPSSGGIASYSGMSVTMVDPDTVAILRAYFLNAIQANGSAAFSNGIQLLTYTKVEGVTLGNDSEESGEFEFPVNFCYGCLVANLALDPNSAVGYCLDTAIAVPTTAQTCVPGQDVSTIVGELGEVADCPMPKDGGAAAIVDSGGG